MKTTVDIPENELKDAMKYAKAKTKRSAIVTALVDYNRRKRMAELVEYSAVSETFMRNEELETLGAGKKSARKKASTRKSRKA
jgi:heterodisulfide reductase subunit B